MFSIWSHLPSIFGFNFPWDNCQIKPTILAFYCYTATFEWNFPDPICSVYMESLFGFCFLWDTYLNIPTPLDLYYNTGHPLREFSWNYMFIIYGVTARQFEASVFLDSRLETLVRSYPLHWPSIVTLVTFEGNFPDLICSVYMESLPANLWLPFSMRHLSKHTHSIGLLL